MENARAGQIEQTPTPSLPEEVVEEILSRIPVKPLLRFRCVCKFWRLLIDSKHFVKYHLEKSRKHPSFAHHRIIAMSRMPSDRLGTAPLPKRHFSLPSLLNEHTTTYVSEFDDLASSYLHIVGSCDGLICFLEEKNKFFLWNPTTRISRQLPCVVDEMIWWSVFKYGFGLDESNGDYKVFCLLIPFEMRSPVVKVYSLKTDSWRTIEFVDCSFLSPVGPSVSGKLHWLGSICDETRVDVVYFDLEKEVCGNMQLPWHIDYYYDLEKVLLSLGKLEECLCLLCGIQIGRLDVLVMKQYGVKESWTKVMTVSYASDSPEHTFFMPLFLGQNGEILFRYSDWPNFLICSPKDKRAWNPVMSIPDESCNAHVYIESLVSPFSSGNSED